MYVIAFAVLMGVAAGATAFPGARIPAIGGGEGSGSTGNGRVPQPPAAPSPPGVYAFAETNGGKPVTFDPCDTVSVWYQLDGEPYPASRDVAEAVPRLAIANGRPVGFQTGRSADGPTIVVRWVSAPWQLPGEPEPDTVGTGEFMSIGLTITSGTVTLAADAGLPPGFGTRSWGVTYLHEFGHAVGLAHVQDTGEVMYPDVVPTRPAHYGPGDLQGLAALGGACERPQ
ncbi:MAG: matrixin family metalloprotease [Acidimicrobiales bacterium]|nr:matrixin family metalloprotease [Acidimicrobiales bacterium]